MNKGFTLLEVMIALAISALVITSAAVLISKSHNDAAYLRKKMAADLAARNLMDRYMIYFPKGKRLSPKFEQNTVKMGGYTFPYTQTVAEASMQGLKKVDLSVYDTNGKTVLRTLTMFAAE